MDAAIYPRASLTSSDLIKLADEIQALLDDIGGEESRAFSGLGGIACSALADLRAGEQPKTLGLLGLSMYRSFKKTLGEDMEPLALSDMPSEIRAQFPIDLDARFVCITMPMPPETTDEEARQLLSRQLSNRLVQQIVVGDEIFKRP